MNAPLTRAQVLKSLLPGLNNLFGMEYKKARTTYKMSFSYGTYKIYKTEYSIELDRLHTTTLAKGLNKETAQGMMKLLESEDE